jgi:hypothetical protein
MRIDPHSIETKFRCHPNLKNCTVELTGTKLAHQARAAVVRGIS